MPGTLTLRPLTANLTRDTEFFGTMDPYCKVILGNQKLSGQVCRNGGKHPNWEDTLVLRTVNEPSFQIEVKEKDWLLPDSIIGSCQVNLKEVENQKRVLKWYPISFESKPVGKILLEINYEPDHSFIQDALPNTSSKEQLLQPNSQNVLNERVNQNQAPKPQEEEKPKKGFLEGLIYGWTPFGSKSQQSPSEKKQEIQAPPEQIQNPLPQNENLAADYDRNNYIHQSQVHQGHNWAPPIAQIQPDSNYPQKYPQFSPQQSMNINTNYPDSYCQNPGYAYPNTENQQNERGEVIDYRNNQPNEIYGSGQYLNEYYNNDNPPQDYQEQNINKFDPLRVIRGL